MDSRHGGDDHMTSARSTFSELDSGIHGTVKFGDGSVIGIEGRGTVLFNRKSGKHQALTGVYHIPRLTTNIISLGQLEEDGFKILLESGFLRIWDRRRRLLAKVPRAANRLYQLTLDITQPVCLAAQGTNAAWRWHARYGHLNFRALRELAHQEMVKGLPQLDHVDQVCDSCLAGKQRRLPFPRKAKYRAQNKLELVHGDIYGPVTPMTPSGNKFFLLLVDDLSRFMWLILLGSKDQAAAAIMRFKRRAEAEAGGKLGTLRTDRGGEFTTHAFAEYYVEQGIQRHLTAPYTPQQNGVVERRNQTIMGMARSMMKAMALPGWFWGEAVTTAVFILNRASTRSVDGKTPFKVWYGYKPPMHYFRTFGCMAHVKTAGKHLGKLDDRSTPMVFVGYKAGTKAYRFYNPVARRVHVSRDAMFEEECGWDWGAEKGAGPEDDAEPFHVEFISSLVRRGEPGAQVVPATQSPTLGTPASPPAPTSAATPTCGSEPSTPPATFTSPLVGDVDLDEDHNDTPLRFRAVDNVLGPVSPPGLVEQQVVQELMVAIDDEPTTAEEAKRFKEWRNAMLEEMASIEQNKTWSLVDLPAGQRAIGLKWVFKLKRDEHGNISKFKARLVAKGYVQRQGVDYEEVFAPVARMKSVRILLAVAAHRGWAVHHMDVKSAFLNGELAEEVYVVQPPGFVAAGHERKVLKLHKALYGLKQAPRAWNAKLDTSLKQLGFSKSEYEHGLYTRKTNTSQLIVGIYVDDLIITGESTKEIKAFKEEMKALFRMSDLGALTYYLGIEVRQGRRGIELSQAAYAKKVSEKAGMGACNGATTPMEARLELSKASVKPAVDATEYRILIGSLRYLLNTRPELSYSVGYLSRFMEEPKEDHKDAVKWLLRYVAGTINHGLLYTDNGGDLDLLGYSDSGMSGDVDGRKSTSGVIFFLGGNPVTWQSQKQRVVALSSCEAEYIAGAAAACQAMWLKRVLGDVLGVKISTPKLRMDNQSAIELSKNPVFHERSKHIDVKFHFIRECVGNGDIDLKFAGTQEQLMDILTKPLTKERFQELREKIGVIKLQ
ncbi:hypothetical protein U9M48_011031 [Paspalum notatum var. saurae]|uniref:Integrase catalytic domain-containing protein n=1 Tax=Paspalum notatum var. saurae TaxID=547442 RepID=A0AAQ3SUD8_PASNO